jgi:hypothetical protein
MTPAQPGPAPVLPSGSVTVAFTATFAVSYAAFYATAQQQALFKREYKKSVKSVAQEAENVEIDSVVPGSIRVATRVIFAPDASSGLAIACDARAGTTCSVLVAAISRNPGDLFLASSLLAALNVSAAGLTVTETAAAPPADSGSSSDPVLSLGSFAKWRIITIAAVGGGGALTTAVFCTVQALRRRRRVGIASAMWDAPPASSGQGAPSSVWGVPSASPVWQNALHTPGAYAETPHWAQPTAAESAAPTAPPFQVYVATRSS